MKLLKYLNYFSLLRTTIGFRRTCVFALALINTKIHPPKNGVLAHIPVGPYTFYFPSLTFFEAIFTEIFFKETYYLIPTQDPIKIIDCGANIGVSLLYFKIRAPHAQILCFEPNPDARTILEKNIEANGWDADVSVLPYALGKKKGIEDFFVDEAEKTSSGGSFTQHEKNKRQVLDSYPVEVDILSRHIEGPIDLLKIDIEGAESDVVEELTKKKVLTQVAAVQLEYHHIPEQKTRSLSAMLALLEAEGFHTFIESGTVPHRVIGRDTWHTYMVFAWR